MAAASALAACRDLLRATERLAAALHAEEHEALAAALEERDARFTAVREVLGDPPEADAEVRELLRRVAALDRRVLASAREAQEGVRLELEAVARARVAARALQSQSPREGPRFFARRV